MSRRLRVLFLSAALDRASTRVRVVNLMPELEKENFRADHAALPRDIWQRLSAYWKCTGYDVVVLQKQLLSRLDAFLLRRFARRLVFDFDDSIFARAVGDGASTASATRRRRFANTVRKCDLVIAGNTFLQREARRYLDKVVTLPSAVPVDNVPSKDHRIDRLELVMGWVGSAQTLPFLEGASDLLRSVACQHSFKLHVVSDGAVHIKGVDTINIPWSLHTQEQEIARFDIGISPLPDNVWTRGKCAYKLLQYMAGGVPFVASAVGMNVEVAANGTTGFAVGTDAEFALKLLKLLGDRELRHRLGTAGRAHVAERYSIEVLGRQLAQRLTEVAA